MATPITVNYTRDGDDWKLIVSRDEKSLAGHAPGLIAARDRADQLVEKLAPKEDKKVVVHLLDGDAFAFTTEYLAARLAKPAPAATPAKSANAGSKPAAEAASPAAPGGAAAKTASGRSTPADAKEAAPAGAKPTDTKAGARKKSAPGSHRAPQEDKLAADAEPAAAAAAEKSDEPKATRSADGPEARDTKKPSDAPSEKSADENAAGSVAARLSGTATDRVAN